MNACPHSPSSKSLLPRGVRRALDAMRANVGRDWSVTELPTSRAYPAEPCNGNSGFFLGKAPRTTLRDVRFDTARRELLQGLPDAKVTDVALRCGFPAWRAVFPSSTADVMAKRRRKP